MKKWIVTCIALLVGLGLLVYLLWIYDTKEIMEEVNRVAQGAPQLDEENYAVLLKKMPYKQKKQNHIEVSKIKRRFTWCFGKKGKIWVHYKIICKHSTEIITNYVTDVVVIEKQECKWCVIDYISPP